MTISSSLLLRWRFKDHHCESDMPCMEGYLKLPLENKTESRKVSEGRFTSRKLRQSLGKFKREGLPLEN